MTKIILRPFSGLPGGPYTDPLTRALNEACGHPDGGRWCSMKIGAERIVGINAGKYNHHGTGVPDNVSDWLDAWEDATHDLGREFPEPLECEIDVSMFFEEARRG